MTSPPSLLPELDDPAGTAYVGVALDLPVDRLFTYRALPEQRSRADVGHRVFVPFRGRTLTGEAYSHLGLNVPKEAQARAQLDFLDSDGDEG